MRFPALEKTLLPVYFLRVEIEVLDNAPAFEECISRICRPIGAAPPMKML